VSIPAAVVLLDDNIARSEMWHCVTNKTHELQLSRFRHPLRYVYQARRGTAQRRV